MKNTITFIILSLVSCLFAGCVAPGNQKVPFPNQSVRIEHPNKARIYVMRPYSDDGTMEYDIRDNDKLVGELAAQTYLCWERDPGAVEVICLQGVARHSESFQAESGKVYYLYLDKGSWVWTFHPASEEEGRKLLNECKPAPLKLN
jgi:hypothetical protein